jgi:hypothetical protein
MEPTQAEVDLMEDHVHVLPVFVEAPRKPSHAADANLVPSAEEVTEGQGVNNDA